MATSSKTVTEVGGRRLTLTNLDKVLYPSTGFTKAAVVDYYARVAPALLPHLAGRALTMVRWPDGVDGSSFFAKRRPPHTPSWVGTAHVDDDLVACVVDDLASLVWVANLAALELHTHQARVDDPESPTSVVFDLDPGEPADVLTCARVALDLHDVLDRLGLDAVVKTSGSKGLHVASPVSNATAEETKAFARALGGLLARAAPDRVTTAMSRDLRAGLVFVDWSQNDRHKTTVCAYSLRAQSRPLVSTPVAWQEVAAAVDAGDVGALSFEPPAVLERVERLGDLYATNLERGPRLPALA